MKKVMLSLCSLLILTGCSSANDIYILQNSNQTYFMVDDEGSVLKSGGFDSYTPFGDNGYIIEKDEKYAYVNRDDEFIVEYGEYQKLEVKYGALIATNDEKSFVLDKKGKILFQDNENTSVIKSGGYVIVNQDDLWMVIANDSDVLIESKEEITYTATKNELHMIGYQDKAELYLDEKIYLTIEGSKLSLLDYSSQFGTLLYKSSNQSIVHIVNEEAKYEKEVKIDDEIIAVQGAYFDEVGNVVVYHGQESYVLDETGNVAFLLNSYYQNSDVYVEKNNQNIYGPHIFNNGDNFVEVTDIQLDPLAGYNSSSIFPVFIKNKGYAYFDYDGKQVIETIYKRAFAFDTYDIAIVSTNENKYHLIDEEGKKISEEYNEIVELEYGFYAGYNSGYRYEVLDVSGEVVIEDEFTTNHQVISDDEKILGVFDLGGRTVVYDMDTYEVVFELPGVAIYKDGYFTIDSNQYYSIEGKEIYIR